jgi:tetratricopeptide (TPR) repeat protein
VVTSIRTDLKMAGESSIQSMIITLRNNRNLLKSRSPYRNKSFFQTKSDYVKYSKGNFDLIKATPEQLETIRTKIKAHRKRELLITTLIIIIILIPVSWLVVFAINLNLSDPPNIETTTITKDTEENFEFYLSDGNKYLRNRKWHNAIFQYEKALEIHPDNYLVNYRLATALTYQCEEKEVDCDKAIIILDSLIKTHPKKQKLEYLRFICYEHLK